MTRSTGTYETTTAAGESVQAFVPHSLPPARPKLEIDPKLEQLLGQATQALVNLNQAGKMIPSLDWFIYAFVRKEAVTSSQIEGTQATLIDLLTFEAEDNGDNKGDADIEEVCNYLEAIKYARGHLKRKNGLPLSMRLLNETHKRLMKGVRGGTKQPGTIRQSQNWIGGARPGIARFVPPPPHALAGLLSDFEKYIHADDKLPPLIRIGLLHVQFETIHPYLDGNGRIGRLLITLLLEHWELLEQPLMYLSLYFKRNRDEYYDRLGRVRTHGDWELWTEFFLDGIATIANEAANLAQELFALIDNDRKKVVNAAGSTVITVRLFELLPLHPIVTMPGVVKMLETTKPTASKAIAALEQLGILVEQSGRKRDRTFGYAAYLEKLRVGTELL
jgi:Fic family protein